KVVLQNGLTVIVRENDAAPLTAITTMVKAGYFDEDDRISGISHVLEHMFFKGTATRPVGEIARETKSLGGYLNAYTYYDRTCYYTVVPAENAVKELAIQADALWNSSFDAEELKREIEVVLQENNRKLDNPSAVASEKLYEVAFQKHRMRRWRIGTPAGLRALTRDDIVAYYSRYYRPSNIILTVVGPFERNQMLAEIARLYGKPAADSSAVDRDASPAEPEQTGPRYAFRLGPIEQSRVAVGFHTPGILNPDTRALEVLAAILAEGRASRMNQYLRNEKGLITSSAASTNAFSDVGYFEIDVETANPVDAQVGVLAELESIKLYGVTNEAVGRAKTQIAQEYLSQMQTVDGIGKDLAVNEALGSWKRSTTYLADIQKVTGPQVVEVTKKYLTEANLSAFVYRPDSAPPSSATRNPVSVEEYRQSILSRVPEATPQHKETELPVSVRIPEMSNSLMAAAPKPIEKRTILHGPDVYILEDHRLPLVSFGIFYPGGRLDETADNSGITELMLRTALRGTTRFDASEIDRRLENAGASIQVVNDPDFFGYVVEGLSERMGQALDVLVTVLQQASFNPQDVEREKVLQLSRIKTLREDNYAFPVRLFMQTLFGDHPYSRPAVGTAEAVEKLKSEDLRKWFQANQRKVLPLIVIAGDTNGTSLVAPLTERLTNQDLTEKVITKLPAATEAPLRGESVQAIDRQQTALVYGFPGAALTGTDRPALVVLQNIVSGMGGRFFDTIREKQGLAYTVLTANSFFARGGAVYTYAAFSPENESAVRASLEQEIERIRRDGVTAEELRKAIAYSVGDREMGMQTRGSLVLEYARAINSGAGVASIAKYSDQIRQVTPAQIQDVVRRYFTPASLRVAIVRGAKKN
ncbi:MAG TPA: pitrilysin family protein, partial [Terriglobia bacterium]|nr:pitrilysin family protein [Terriglobia bacterium]